MGADYFWPPGDFIPPQDIVAYTDDVAVSTTFYYKYWVDDVTKICGSEFCGTRTYSFKLLDSSAPVGWFTRL